MENATAPPAQRGPRIAATENTERRIPCPIPVIEEREYFSMCYIICNQDQEHYILVNVPA